MINKPIVKKIQLISPVWIVPIVALAIAVWLAVEARLERGTEIEITFESANDIIPGQTMIKLKDVEVGKVTQVKLSSDLKSVVVKAEIDRDVSAHLSENSRFWVVTPRISATGVSNLGTLISGVYIIMDPGEKGGFEDEFVGLDEQPAFHSDESGTQYMLKTDTLGSLDIGSPIYYRQIRVGEVTGYRLSDNQEFVEVSVFVRAPHDQMVQRRSRFWNVSGFGVSINADGMKAQMASLSSLIAGGITFDNTASFGPEERADEGYEFFLYPDRESVLEGRFSIKYFYLMKFSGSVRGLTVGAPVEFRGIKVGEVVDVVLDNADNTDKSLHVYIAMEPQRFDPSETPSKEEVDARMESMVSMGLRGQMKTASLLTGSRFIDLVFVDDMIAGEFQQNENYSEIPTVEDSVDAITKQLADILDKVEQIPFDKIGQDLSSSIENLNGLLSGLNDAGTSGKVDGVVQSLEDTLKVFSDTMKSVDLTLSPDSEVIYELGETLNSVGGAADSLEEFLDELNRNPDALLRGAEKDD